MAKRNSFRGPGFWNLDGGIYKTFHLTERYSLQFRGEMYNVFNHANLYVNSSTADISAGAQFVQACRGCATSLNSNGVTVPTDRRNVHFITRDFEVDFRTGVGLNGNSNDFLVGVGFAARR